MSTSQTPKTDAAIVEIVDEEATRKAGSNVTAVRRRWVRPDFARQLEREVHEAKEEAAMWRHHIATCLAYPRGSEAQVRCLEEVGQDASHYEKKAALDSLTQTHEPAKA